MEQFFTADNLAALVTLTVLEIVLGIDNIVFISILAGKLEGARQARARRIGLILAMFSRIALLLGITWIMGLTQTIFEIPVIHHAISGRDLILIVGGGFLIAKATQEIHDRIEGSAETLRQPKSSTRFGSILLQIVAMDIIFSLDSVITAVGMVPIPTNAAGDPVMGVAIATMIIAIVIAICVMLVFSGPIARFIENHPTTKMLALAFLFMIGMVLVADGLGKDIPKGYIYAAMTFSLGVELLNLRVKKQGDAAVPTDR